MKINQEMRRVEVFYDGECGMCVCFVTWFQKQALRVPVDCMPYQEKEVLRRFPDLMDYEPEKHVVARADTGEMYQGGETSVLLLWLTRRYGWVGSVLKTWPIFPVVQCAYKIAAANRQLLSKVFFRKSMARCQNGKCGIR